MQYEELFVVSELPKPLNKEQLIDYFEKYKNNGDVEAREKLIEHNVRLVMKVVHSFKNPLYSKEELVSLGMIGLIKSVDTFDYTRGINFSTYANKCIVNEILMFLRNENKGQNNISMQHTLIAGSKSKRQINIEDVLEDESSDFVADYEKKELYLSLHKVIDKLPQKEQEIINLFFGLKDGRPLRQREIASILNISQSYVSRIVVKTLEKIKIVILAKYPEYKQISKVTQSQKQETEGSNNNSAGKHKQKKYVNK